jgi:hypothetical protein
MDSHRHGAGQPSEPVAESDTLKNESVPVVRDFECHLSLREIFGDAVAVAAMVDRLLRRVEIIVRRRDSCWLKGKGKEVLQPEGS